MTIEYLEPSKTTVLIVNLLQTYLDKLELLNEQERSTIMDALVMMGAPSLVIPGTDGKYPFTYPLKPGEEGGMGK